MCYPVTAIYLPVFNWLSYSIGALVTLRNFIVNMSEHFHMLCSAKMYYNRCMRRLPEIFHFNRIEKDLNEMHHAANIKAVKTNLPSVARRPLFNIYSPALMHCPHILSVMHCGDYNNPEYP